METTQTSLPRAGFTPLAAEDVERLEQIQMQKLPSVR